MICSPFQRSQHFFLGIHGSNPLPSCLEGNRPSFSHREVEIERFSRACGLKNSTTQNFNKLRFRAHYFDIISAFLLGFVRQECCTVLFAMFGKLRQIRKCLNLLCDNVTFSDHAMKKVSLLLKMNQLYALAAFCSFLR